MTSPKELYEHLEVLLLATEGTGAEASLDYVVDALRFTTPSDASVARRWQRTYRPTDAELAARSAAVQAPDPVRNCYES